MTELTVYLENAGAIAFFLLGVVTVVGWARRRDRSLGFLALAIVCLSLVTLVSRIPAGFQPPLLSQITLLLFMGSGYALLRFRGALIPLPYKWHVVAVAALLVAIGGFFIAERLVAAGTAPASLLTGAGYVFILVWSATILEPIARFWLVARTLPAVQAWRLRALSFGFGGLVGVLLFAIAAGAFASQPLVLVFIQVAIILIVPLLYVSFSPPGWLRRQWRSSEEEGLRAFMQDQLLGENTLQLADRALEWAMRLVGGVAAVAYDGGGGRLGSRGLTPEQLSNLDAHMNELRDGVGRIAIDDIERTLFVLPLAGTGSHGRLVVVAGPFTPHFGSEELNRVQQFMTAVEAAVDRSRLLEKLKEANADLLDANRHKSVFLANMSHELRTPLNAILGFSELLIDSTDGQFPDETKGRFLEQIHSSGQHLLGLINDILDLSKIEAGQMELRLQMVSVGGVVGEVAATVEALAAKKNIHVELDASNAGQVLADEGKLKQMILNLVSNALKFTPDGGSVKIEAARVMNRLEIAVTDNGIGIAEQDISRMFKEFQQVDSGVNRTQQGTGLGLALTRSFAKLHGGDVRVESKLGKGSRFTISLPIETGGRAPAPKASNGSVETPVGDLSRPMILVVEDDPAAAELLARHIERAGFRTENARTGTDAVKMAKEHKPIAITLDILLPDGDGWSVLTQLKRDEATSDIPVIVVSVVDDPELGTALGALDYFVKPVEGKALIDRLSNFNFQRKSNGKQTSILVVDDESGNRDWLKNLLEPAGFQVTLASGGKQAIELANLRKPDLVMLDLLMPEVSGFDVVDALSANKETKAIPIMILTAKDLTGGDIEQLTGHVSRILRRGSTGAVDLLSQLRAVLNKRTVSK